jgi:hypothetical protein
MRHGPYACKAECPRTSNVRSMGVFGLPPNVVKIEPQLLRVLWFALPGGDHAGASTSVGRAKHPRMRRAWNCC